MPLLAAKEYLATGHFKILHGLSSCCGTGGGLSRLQGVPLASRSVGGGQEGGGWLVDCIKVGPGGVSEV